MAKKDESIDEQQVKEWIERGVKKLEHMDCGNKKGVKHHASCSGAAGTVWFLGFVGGAVYFIGQASSFMEGTIGVLKALVWPAYLVYYLFEYLGL